jgi:hypothetical protein
VIAAKLAAILNEDRLPRKTLIRELGPDRLLRLCGARTTKPVMVSAGWVDIGDKKQP